MGQLSLARIGAIDALAGSFRIDEFTSAEAGWQIYLTCDSAIQP
ncbi:hypothetical protein Poly30_03730 [Planctomycetes bacterium Poly30]|uniref:Uncharacterized protein n=1 Tax=Saltatorellus ferox TaxID=2528018 RepID=A0A518ELA6_9BACT|nr:hypothetical protein Poly30_03730 [Planctomycetes bacterium Poly30]